MRYLRSIFKEECPVLDSVKFGMILALVGGFLDAYTYIGRGGIFCNAQTGNIVLMGVYAGLREWNNALIHIPPIIAFMSGVFCAELIKNTSKKKYSLDWASIVILIELISIVIVGFIPGNVSNIPVSIIISFTSSLQVSSFRKLVDSPYNTTMSTGNLRSATQAAYNAITKKDHQSAIRSIRYYLIIISFISGALIGGVLTDCIGLHAIWVAGLLLAGGLVLYLVNRT
jgi:Predicted membrane protein